LFLVLVLPPLLAAPLRVVCRLPIWAAMTLGLLSALAAAWSSELVPRGDKRLRRIKAAALATVALVSCWCLYSRALGGLPAWISSDSGNHAATLRLSSGDPTVYGGFASMYIAWRTVEWLTRLNTFWAFAILFYAEVALLAVVPLAIAFASLRRFEGRPAWIAGAGAATLTALVGMTLVALPLVHYFQAEGFWSQLFSIVPLLVLWWVDASFTVWWQRILGWAVGVVLFRYTYALNLAELCVAFGCVLIADTPPRLRILAFLAAAGTVFAAIVTIRELNLVVTKWGWFVGYDVKRALWAGGAALLAMAAASAGSRLFGDGLERALRMPLLFCAGSFAVTAVYRYKYKPSYYIFKYPFVAICLAAVAAAILVGVAAATLAERRRWRELAWGVACAALVATSVTMWFKTFAEYHGGYLERVRGGTPKILRPLADLGAWKIIDEALAAKKKEFGGYLVSYGPMSNFMNSAMGIGDGQDFYFKGKPPKSGPGYCVFLDRTAPDPWPEFNRWYRHRGLADRMNREPSIQCVEYSAHWDPALRRRICHLCK
jgi:hypothetical protein